MSQTPSLAAVLRHTGRPLSVEKVVLPPPGRNQVLVRLELASICATQIGEIAGIRGPDKYLPHMLGHEGVGEVVEIGQGVRHLGRGDKVVLHWRPGEGKDGGGGQAIDSSSEHLNFGPVSTFAAYTVASANRLTRVPDGIDNRLATLLGCSLLTGFAAVKRELRPKPKDVVVVFGAGALGLSVVYALLRFGVTDITVVDVSNSRLTFAKSLGSVTTILVSEATRSSGDVFAGRRFDVAIDTTGSDIVPAQAFRSLTEQGRLHLMGVIGGGKSVAFPPMEILLGKKITGSNGGSALPAQDIPDIVSDSSALDFARNLPGHFIELQQINEAVELTRLGNTVKVFLTMPGGNANE